MRLVGVTVILAMACGFAAAQAKFEAADVHVSAPDTNPSGGYLPTGRAEFHGVTLLELIGSAYSVSGDQISGGPAWLATDRFDVVAKAPGKAATGALQSMMQALLAERFGLEVKREEKPMPVFALVVKKAGVLKESTSAGEPECKRNVEDGAISYTCRKQSMANFAEALRLIAGAYFDKPVVDRTGLNGEYDFHMEWYGRGRAVGPNSGMTIFVQMEKQLGVTAEPATAPMAVLSIGKVNHTPTPNAPNVTELLGAPPTAFDVATIRPSRPDETQSGSMKNGVVEMKALTLRQLIGIATNIDEEMVRGGEKYVETDRFDILAKTEPTLSIEALQKMLRGLLEERFHLKAHVELQPVTVHALTAPKSKLKDADPTGRPGCKITIPDGVRTLVCTNATMAMFVERIQRAASGYLDNPVVDLTGLKGNYDFSVGWAPKQNLAAKPSPAGGTEVAPDRPVGLTVFEAIDKQLGLKLATQKHPMPVVIIDHVDRKPTEN
jgi:uncharacterized protein (TIGR03435 family)